MVMKELQDDDEGHLKRMVKVQWKVAGRLSKQKQERPGKSEVRI